MFPKAAIPLLWQLVACLGGCVWAIVLGSLVARIRFGPNFYNRPLRMCCTLFGYEYLLRVPLLVFILHRVRPISLVWDFAWLSLFIVGAEIGLQREKV